MSNATTGPAAGEPAKAGPPNAEAPGAPLTDPVEAAADPLLRHSLDYCKKLTRTRARNFYYGLKLTPEPQRSALYAVYAFMRACDDLVDEPVKKARAKGTAADATVSPARQDWAIKESIARIERFRGDMLRVLGSPHGARPRKLETPESEAVAPPEIWPAFRYVAQSYPIDQGHLNAMLDGQRCDLTKHSYQNFEELYDYCYKVASVVGLVCVSVWGAGNNPAARRLAECRGVALQLTNIIRDVVEDARRGRVYIPADELARFNYPAGGFLEARGDQAFGELMAFQIQRARRYYEMSDALEGLLPPPCRSTSWAIMRIYRALLEKIAKDPTRVLTERVRLSSFSKAAIAMRATWRRFT